MFEKGMNMNGVAQSKTSPSIRNDQINHAIRSLGSGLLLTSLIDFAAFIAGKGPVELSGFKRTSDFLTPP